MGNPTSSSSKSLHLCSLALASLVLFSLVCDGDAAVDRKLIAAESHEFHTIQVSSLLPDSVCSSQGLFPSFPSLTIHIHVSVLQEKRLNLTRQLQMNM